MLEADLKRKKKVVRVGGRRSGRFKGEGGTKRRKGEERDVSGGYIEWHTHH
jgi:hypothetical protein